MHPHQHQDSRDWFVDSSFPPRVGNSCEPLVNGVEYFAAIKAELKRSKSFWIALSFGNEYFVAELVRFAFSVGVEEVLILAWKPLPNPLFSGYLTEQFVAAQKWVSHWKAVARNFLLLFR
jgi:hypothetical protein